VLMAAMLADVCDEDELQTGERREGTFSAVYWWIVKMGLSASLALSGVLLKATGFDEKLGGGQGSATIHWMRICDIVFPAAFIAIAIYLIYKFPLTEERVYQIKAKLKDRQVTAA
jgi:GPH family glycoside/pentoside/hexuronide:cation symporter